MGRLKRADEIVHLSIAKAKGKTRLNSVGFVRYGQTGRGERPKMTMKSSASEDSIAKIQRCSRAGSRSGEEDEKVGVYRPRLHDTREEYDRSWGQEEKKSV